MDNSPLYSRRLDEERRARGWTFSELHRRAVDTLPTGQKLGRSTVALYLGSGGTQDPPREPRRWIVEALAAALGVSVAYVVGDTDDPSQQGEADVRHLIWARLKTMHERRGAVLERAFPDLRRLSPTAKAALQDTVTALRTAELRRGANVTEDVAAKRVAKAITSAMKALGLDEPSVDRTVSADTPAALRTTFLHIPTADLSDFVTLTCTALRRVL